MKSSPELSAADVRASWKGFFSITRPRPVSTLKMAFGVSTSL